MIGVILSVFYTVLIIGCAVMAVVNFNQGDHEWAAVMVACFVINVINLAVWTEHARDY